MTTNDTFISNLSQAARDNPLAAALIGGGALWLLLGNRAVGNAFTGATSLAQPLAESGMRGISSAADAVSGAAGAMASAGGRAADATTDAARSIMRGATDAAADAASAVRDRATDTLERTSDTLGRGGEALRSANSMPRIQQGYAGAQSALTDLLERQPLVIGAIGLAIGACCANALASTAIEDEWAGPVSDELKEAVKGRAERVAETATRAAGEAGSEFRAAASEAVDTLRKAGQDVVQSVRETGTAGRH
jgi:ElaB/YqjD/DUF883 family membrane-anchored ribosome-binding protein